MSGSGVARRGRLPWLSGVLGMGACSLALALALALALTLAPALVLVLALEPASASAAPAWSAPAFLNVGIGNADTGLTGLACPTSTQCVAVDVSGREVAFNPADPSGWSAYSIDGAHGLAGVSCAAASQCVAVDGLGNEITFDPQQVGASPRPHLIDPGLPLNAVACVSTSLCIAADADGQVVGFSPVDPSAARIVSVASGGLLSLACPSSTQCTVLAPGSPVSTTDPSNEALITLNPQMLGVIATIAVPDTVPLSQIACPSISECVGEGFGPGAGEAGLTATFDPTSSSIASVAARSALNYLDVACMSVTECTAMDISGTEVTFDPSSSGVLEQAAVDPIGDYSKGFNGSHIACLPTGECVLATSNNPAAIAFAPLSPGKPTPAPIDDGAPIAALACPAPGDCIALADTQPKLSPEPIGVAASLDPRAPSHVNDAAQFLGTVAGLACPTRSQCTAVMAQKTVFCHCAGSDAVTFDPARPTARSAPGIKIDTIRISGLACAGARECVTVDLGGREVTFNPARPRASSVHSESAGALSAIACPSATQCTAISTAGTAVTFTPGTGALISRRQIDSAKQLTAIACPTVEQCSATDQRGHVLTFDPRQTGRLVRHEIGTAAPTAIACSSQRLCVAVNTAGQAAVGDPAGPHPWTIAAIPGASSLLSVACTAHAVCVAADSTGHVFSTR
jgi:hypothetical protein